MSQSVSKLRKIRKLTSQPPSEYVLASSQAIERPCFTIRVKTEVLNKFGDREFLCINK